MPKNHRLDKWEAQHRRNLTKYEAQIVELFRGAVREAASLTHLLGDFNPEKPFLFSDYPITQQRVERLLGGLKNDIYGVIVNGVRSEWTLANNKNNELCNQVFGDAIGALSQEQYERYYSTNPKAEEAFLARAEQGLNLSDRVWKYTDQFKEEIEMGLDLGLRQGLSADEMSKQLRSFLMHPNTLFRRVRDEHGQLQLSKAAKAYHPGRGVYRSSYKNARRLAATECNIAYRTADYERWQDLDFVVGMRIVLSNNHTLNGEPFEDICDQLSAPLGSKATSGRGCYPKDFKFTGWHPLCRCHTESILKTREEMAADNARILAGEPVSPRSVNTVDDVPKEFKDWVENNTSRIVRANQLPYFMTDNTKYVSSIMQGVQPSSKIASQMATDHFWEYAEKFKGASEKMNRLYNQLGSMSPDIERAMIVNQMKHECASLTHQQLLASGHIGEDWVLVRKEFNSVIQSKTNYFVKGKLVSLPETKMDLLIYRDSVGREFAYPFGADKTLFKATTASEVIQEFPPYLRRGVKRVSFLGVECPADAYWKAQYNNPKHRSMATDGGRTTFFGTPSSREDFKGYMSHEAGHILDGAKHRFSSSVDWQEAVSKDDALYAKFLKGQHRVSSYAKTNDAEDFAECIRMYITDHEYFKQAFPNRAAFIRRMAQKISGHYKS